MSAAANDIPTTTPIGLRGGAGTVVTATAPGRVNLIGEHTDYTGGLALPMAIHLGTTVRGVRGGGAVRLTSGDRDEPAVVPIDVEDPAAISPSWARYVAGVVAEVRPAVGFTGTVGTTVPIGAGLSSSAALELAVALALGFTGTTGELARLGQRAEQAASGVPCGLMDQLTSACGRAGHALLIDFTSEHATPVALPDDVDVVVVHSGQERQLAGSAYAERRSACEAIAASLGPLRTLTVADVEAVVDPVLRRRARHVVSENARVLDVAEALERSDGRAAGALLVESHRSLRDDFEVSTPVLDALVDDLVAAPGVLGARLTGAGFGGCVVALTERGALDLSRFPRAWRVAPSAGARVRASSTTA